MRAGREWAHALQRREESGEDLTQFQRDAWRVALRTAHRTLNAVRDGADIDEDDINAALRVTGDLPQVETKGVEA